MNDFEEKVLASLASLHHKFDDLKKQVDQIEVTTGESLLLHRQEIERIKLKVA